MTDQRANFGTRGLSPAVAAAGDIPPSRSTRAFAAFEWMIALRYLRAKRKESFISVISIISLVGITLGVSVLIIVMAVMNGFRDELLSKILGLNGHAAVQGTMEGLPDFDSVAARVRAIPGVVHASPMVEGQVMVTSNGASLGAQVRGMRPEDLKAIDTISNSISQRAIERYRRGDSIIIGTGLAQKLGLVPGMPITLIAPRGNVTPFGTTPRIKSYTIAGTFDSGMAEYNNIFIFMPLDEAQLYFNLGRNASSIQIMVTDPDRVHYLVDAMQKAAGPYARVRTWQDLNLSLFDAVQVEHNVMFLILALIMLVASLNIVSGLIMLVKDKSGDIAILRTMGATRGAIMRIFLIAGASVGIVGTILGLLLGTLFSAYIDPIQKGLSWVFGVQLFNSEVYFLTHMPSKMEPGDVVWVAFISLSLSLLATIYPSWRAASLDPVEALRYE
jgi:lipoprotein-releasing system permease protein